MDRGYITIALRSGDSDYLRMAYCLALSLKLTQSRVHRLCVLVEDAAAVPERYRWAFDHIVELPHGDDSRPDGWRVQNYHQVYAASPYEETATVDADMLFFADVSPWWEVMARKELVAATRVLDYRGQVVSFNPLRAQFYEHGLPDVHNGFLYFKKGPENERLFATMRAFTRDWEATCERFFGRGDVHYSGDCSLVLALRELGLERECQNHDTGGIPMFVHMKTCLQGWPGAQDKDWRKYADHRFSPSLELTVGGFDIRYPFHYHVRDFVSDELLAAYERAVAGDPPCSSPPASPPGSIAR